MIIFFPTVFPPLAGAVGAGEEFKGGRGCKVGGDGGGGKASEISGKHLGRSSSQRSSRNSGAAERGGEVWRRASFLTICG